VIINLNSLAVNDDNSETYIMHISRKK